MRAFVLYILALGLFAQSGQKDASHTVGVLFASSGWKMGSTAVKSGQYLPPTATLTSTEPAELMLGCEQRGWLSYACLRYPCKVPVCSLEPADAQVKRVDKAAGSDAPAEAGLGERLMSWLTRPSPPPPITAGVRAGGNPNDAVVLLENGGKVHLAPALTRVLEGDYCFGLLPLGDAAKRAPLAFRMTWNREEEPEGLVTLKDISPGAYALEKEIADQAGSCQADADAFAAWVVIASPDQFHSLADRWKANRAWLDSLSKSGAGAGVIATARHAMIAQLSESIAQ